MLEKVQLMELAMLIQRRNQPGWASREIIFLSGKTASALARVLIETPQVLILDEATASIDSGTEQAIQRKHWPPSAIIRRWWLSRTVFQRLSMQIPFWCCIADRFR
ncbi:hypothetical protein KIF59_24095 [Enterobacter cloacae subsp. cloacae]|nr:hypothetical protein [Enterobacter cloacae subsp. cloacae]